MERDRPRLVYIGGAGHSGSTLLSMLLNNHPAMQPLGEVHRIGIFLRKGEETCTCGAPLGDCPFWVGVDANLARLLGVERPLETLEFPLAADQAGRVRSDMEKALLVAGPPGLYRMLGGWLIPRHAAAIKNSLALYEAARQASGRPIVVDSSKDARRLKALYMHAPEGFRVIHIHRDGRAVTASAMRRRSWSMDEAAAQWVKDEQRQRWAMRGIPEARILDVGYETLCRAPEETLAAICRFVGVDPVAGMSTLKKESAHDVSGNLMRFRRDEQTIQLDESWRQRLTQSDLATYARVAGPTHERLGYGW